MFTPQSPPNKMLLDQIKKKKEKGLTHTIYISLNINSK